jgi:hypothetical protein
MLATLARWVRNRSKRWLVLACLALMVVFAPVAVHTDEATKYFDIKAQSLAEALMAFGAQTGAIVIASSELTTGKISGPVTGRMTSEEALTRMLQGTGLRFETSANGTILIVHGTLSGR